MKRLDFDTLGDTQKAFEAIEATRTLMPGLPVLARLDGRAFHTFTKGLARPFDPRLAEAMQETTKELVRRFTPNLGYTQSDEITLVWLPASDTHLLPIFSGRIAKLTSSLAAMASVVFNKEIAKTLSPSYLEQLPTFDARVWSVPNARLAAENFLWREMDATKNSVSALASSKFSEKTLHGLSTSQRKGLLFEEGIVWDNLPNFAKRGIYYKRRTVSRDFTEEELTRLRQIPNWKPPEGPILRTAVEEVNYPSLTTIANLAGVLFNDEPPVLEKELTDESNSEDHS